MKETDVPHMRGVKRMQIPNLVFELVLLSPLAAFGLSFGLLMVGLNMNQKILRVQRILCMYGCAALAIFTVFVLYAAIKQWLGIPPTNILVLT